MKKFVVVLLLLFSTMLFGCKKKENTGGANTTHPNMFLKDIYTQALIDSEKAQTYELKTGTLKRESLIAEVTEYYIRFDSGHIYSMTTNSDFAFDPTLAINTITSGNYIRIDYTDKHLIFHKVTARLLYTLPKEATLNYTFNMSSIIVRELVDGVFEEKQRYLFNGYDPIDETSSPEETPVQLPDSKKIDDYYYDETSTGITVYHKDAFHTHYYFEAGYDSHHYLSNGDIISQHKILLPKETKEYTYVSLGDKYKLVHYLFSVREKKVKMVDLGIDIFAIMPTSDKTPYNVDNILAYMTIDKISKTVVPLPRLGSISNDLKIKEVVLDFGMPDQIYPYSPDSYLMKSGTGLYLIDGENKIINSMYVDFNNYRIDPIDHEMVLIYHITTRDAFIYNLRDGTLLHSNYKYIEELQSNERYLFEKDDKSYIFDGKMNEVNGQMELLSISNVYLITTETSYMYYFFDGTKLFESSVKAIIESPFYPDVPTYVFTYKLDGETFHTYIKIIDIA